MKKLFLVIFLCLPFLFGGEAIGQITVTGGGGGGSAAVTETASTYTITKTNIVLAGAVTVTSISFTTVVATTSITVGSDALNKDGAVIWIDASGGTGSATIASDGLTFSGFGGGVDVDAAFTASTVTSDAGIGGTIGTFTTYVTSGDTTTGDNDGFYYFAEDGDATGPYLSWNDGNTGFEISSNGFGASGIDTRVDIMASGNNGDATLWLMEDRNDDATDKWGLFAGGNDGFLIKNTATRFAIAAATGNVGIGPDTTPDYFLDVQGLIHVDGTSELIGDVTIGILGSSELTPTLSIIGDANSDAEDVDETFAITITPASDPTDALITATTTQSAGFDFDMPLFASTLTSDAGVTSNGTVTTVGLNQPGVAVTNAADYTVLAANTGKRHIIGDHAQVTTIQLPTEAAGLNYEFWYYGAAAETHDHIILTTGNGNAFKGGVVFLDVANAISQSNGNGSSNSSLTLNNMNGGTFIKMFCDGTNWFVTGNVVSDAAPTWADQ